MRTPLLRPVEDELNKHRVEIIEPSVVADAVIESITRCSGGQIMLPSSASKASLVRALPNWIQESVRGDVSKMLRNTVQ